MAMTNDAQEHADVIARYAGKYNENRIDELDEVLHPDFVIHGVLGTEETLTFEEYQRFAERMVTAFPDMQYGNEAMIVEGDTVAVRSTMTGTHEGDLFGIQPTGNEIEVTELLFCRMQDGKVIEKWDLIDGLSLLQQLGVVSEQVLE
jgi:predicted ester cyclase